MKTVRERMDIISAYREVGSYRGAAEICSTTHRTVKRVVEAAESTEGVAEVAHNYDSVSDLVAQRVEKTKGRITAAGSTGRRNASVSRQHQLSLTEGDGDGKAVHR